MHFRAFIFCEACILIGKYYIKQIFDIIKKINQQNKTTIFIVEQNANLALKAANRGYVMENGAITLTDSGENLLANEEVKKAYLGI